MLPLKPGLNVAFMPVLTDDKNDPRSLELIRVQRTFQLMTVVGHDIDLSPKSPEEIGKKGVVRI